jgi:hypothetical protein
MLSHAATPLPTVFRRVVHLTILNETPADVFNRPAGNPAGFGDPGLFPGGGSSCFIERQKHLGVLNTGRGGFSFF